MSDGHTLLVQAGVSSRRPAQSAVTYSLMSIFSGVGLQLLCYTIPVSSVFFYTGILSFVSGIFLRSFFVFGWPVVIWGGVLALGLGAIILQTWARADVRGLAVVLITLVFFCLGIGRVIMVPDIYQDSPLLAQVGQKVTLTGYVTSEPDIRTGTAQLTVAVDNDLVLVTTDRHTPVRYGDTVDLAGTLKQPAAFTTDLGREFDYPGYLASKDIGYVMSFAAVTVTDNTTGNGMLRSLFLAKAKFLESLETVLPEPAVGLGEGLILGVKQALGEDLEDIFRQAGIIHIVVLSGYNIMIVVAFIMFVLAPLPLRVRVIVGLISIVVFAVLVGLGASVVRASIMAALSLLALVLDRRYHLLRALMIAGVGMLVFNPLLLVHDVGFQLSFLATLGLIMFAPQFELVFKVGSVLLSAKQFLIATLATQIAVLPLLLYQMGQVSVVAVIVNVLVLPLVAPAMLTTFLTGLLAVFIPTIVAPFALCATLILQTIISLATFFAGVPYASVSVPQFPFILVPILYALLGYGLYWWLHRPSPRVIALTDSLTEVSGWTVEEESVLLNRLTPKNNDSGRAQSARPPLSQSNSVTPPPPHPPSFQPPIFFR